MGWQAACSCRIVRAECIWPIRRARQCIGMGWGLLQRELRRGTSRWYASEKRELHISRHQGWLLESCPDRGHPWGSVLGPARPTRRLWWFSRCQTPAPLTWRDESRRKSGNLSSVCTVHESGNGPLPRDPAASEIMRIFGFHKVLMSLDQATVASTAHAGPKVAGSDWRETSLASRKQSKFKHLRSEQRRGAGRWSTRRLACPPGTVTVKSGKFGWAGGLCAQSTWRRVRCWIQRTFQRRRVGLQHPRLPFGARSNGGWRAPRSWSAHSPWSRQSASRHSRPRWSWPWAPVRR